jgi:[FeFe] hydrogenase H-cluster maturation GTPase HydF
MSLNSTPASGRVHIGIFGKRNAGKSSLINAITGQDLAVVSDVSGTTTDPVLKSMELLPLGPVLMIDTPGLDDTGELGALRVRKSIQILNKTDIAVLTVNAEEGFSPEDAEIIHRIQKKKIPLVIAVNKADIPFDHAAKADVPPALSGNNCEASGAASCEDKRPAISASEQRWINAELAKYDLDPQLSDRTILVSAATGYHLRELKELIAAQNADESQGKRIVGDLINPGDLAVLVVPVDSAAPKGRLILPQQQTIRDLLDTGALSLVCRETELADALAGLRKKPAIVITDSQAFKKVAAVTPDDIPLTSFSILMARYKGNLETLVNGVRAVRSLKDGDPVLISEGCTHHRQCDDIGTVKLPRLLRNFTGVNPEFSWSSGTGFPDDLTNYKMIIHCGGCMLNEREMKYRVACATDAGVPITNYGVFIAYAHGILKRSLSVFPDLASALD